MAILYLYMQKKYVGLILTCRETGFKAALLSFFLNTAKKKE